MSYNVYKQELLNSSSVTIEAKKRLINSNQLVQEKVNQLLRERRLAQAADKKEGFQEGLEAPEIDVIPPEPEISLEEIRQQADQMIADAKNEAQKLIEQAKEQTAEIEKQAREKGVEQGRQEGMQEAQKFLEQEKQALEQQRQQMEQEYKQQYASLEPELLDTILEVVEHVFHVQFDESKETILQMIEGTITDIEGSRKFHIKVNPANYAFLEAHKYEIQNKVSSDSEIEFVQDNLLDMNDCVIETESGVYDCGLDVQLNNLFRELRSLSVVEG